MPAATTTATTPVAPCSRGGSVAMGREIFFSPHDWKGYPFPVINERKSMMQI